MTQQRSFPAIDVEEAEYERLKDQYLRLKWKFLAMRAGLNVFISTGASEHVPWAWEQFEKALHALLSFLAQHNFRPEPDQDIASLLGNHG